MTEKLASRIDLLGENTLEVKNRFFWQNTLTKRLAALLYAMEGKAVDCDAIQQSHELIKRNTGMFSQFRGNMAIAVAALLSFSENREQLLSDTLTLYGRLKDARFWSSDYLVMAAYQIAAHADPQEYDQTIERARAFYEGMKARHWFHTGQDDYIYAVMLGLSDIPVPEGTDRMERLYTALKPQFFSGNSVQALTQVLVLGGETEQTVARLLALCENLRARKLRMDRENTLPILGMLTLLPADVDILAGHVEETYTALRMLKGFGSLSTTKQELLLLSAALVASVIADDAKSGVLPALSTSIANIIIAQQAAMAAIAASSAAAASSSSSS